MYRFVKMVCLAGFLLATPLSAAMEQSAPSAGEAAAQRNAASLVNGAIRSGTISPAIITGLIEQGLRAKQSRAMERLQAAVGGFLGGNGTPLSILALGGPANGIATNTDAMVAAGRDSARAVQGLSALGAISGTPQGIVQAVTGTIFAQKVVNSLSKAQADMKVMKPSLDAAVAAARIVPQPDRAWEARAMMIALDGPVGSSYGWTNKETGSEGSIVIREAPPENDPSLVGVARAGGDMEYSEADALREVTDPDAQTFFRLPLVCRMIDRSYQPGKGEARIGVQLACKDHEVGWFVME